MTVEQVISGLQALVVGGLSPQSVVKAYNGDTEQLEEVSGFLYGDKETEICTDGD